MKSQALKLRDLPSGQTLRNYRKRLSTFGIVPESNVLTTKFKLELPDGCSWSNDNTFEDCIRLYDAIEGCGKGTLTHFLFSVLLAGFRIFSSAAEATLFSNRRAYDEAGFRTALTEAVGAPLPNFTVVKLLKQLSTIPRARGGKDISFVPEVIVREFRKTLCKTVPRQVNEEYVDRLFEEIAYQITVRFASWKQLIENKEQACAAVDDALKGFADFPSLEAMAKAAQTQLPEGSSIAYDDMLPFIAVNAENQTFAPYAVVATILSYPERNADEKPSSFVAAHLTTSTASGLSWLFSKGIELFRKESVARLCELYGIAESESHRIETVKAAALAVPEQALLFKSKKSLGYHDFRSGFAGRTDSWTTNYINRLLELKAMLQELGDTLELPDLQRDGLDFLSSADCSKEEVEILCKAYAEGRQRACVALDHLLGSDAANIVEDVSALEAYSRVVNRLYALREQIINALKQAKEDRNSPWKSLWSEVQCDFKSWMRLERLPKLNQMSGGVPHVGEELQQTMERFISVNEERSKHFEMVMAWAQSTGDNVDVLESIAAQERIRADKRSPGQYDGQELALRRVLQRIAHVVRDRTDGCADAVRCWFAENRVFAQKSEFNKFFYNHLGSIYVSPFSNRRHQAYALSAGIVGQGESLLKNFRDLLEKENKTWLQQWDAAETYVRLTGLMMNLRISSLKRPVPSSVAALHLDNAAMADVVPEGVRLQMNLPEVSPAILAKAFNAYESLISGALIMLRRERFYLRTKFLWVGNNALVYVPKNRKWNPPERYARSEIWKQIFALDILVFDDLGAVDVQKTFARAVGILDRVDARSAVRELLHQLPHDWCYELPLKDASLTKGKKGDDPTLLDAILVAKEGAKGTQLSARKVSSNRLARLVGPSLHKERLNQLLLDSRTTVGDMTLLADQEMSQNINLAEAMLSRGKLEFSLAVPISTPALQPSRMQSGDIGKKSSVLPFKRVVAIDQGEAGFAFAVFNLDEAGNAWAQPIAQGIVHIPSIRRLIRAVRGYRKGRQGLQKFNQRYDSTMFTMRENVAGDVCGAIAGLMSRYSALPVLEYQVSNLANGGKQLELVYKMVNARFIADKIQAHETERVSWWYGGKGWTIPGYWQEVGADYAAAQKNKKSVEILEKDGRFYRRLYVSPGTAVNARWTSRICSQCGCNVSELIEKAQEAGMKTATLDRNGEVTLFDQTLRLYKRPSASASKDARRRNERADWLEPMADVTLSLDDLHKVARSNLRRPPKSLQTKDTTQSRYFCVFKNCACHNQEQHADINAAINIGRRFLQSLLKD